MRAVVQRVRLARVEVAGEVVGRIGLGLLVYVGVAPSDTDGDARKLAEKIAFMRIFPDSQDKLNLSVQDVDGGILIVPNFTLQADTRKGRRPAFNGAAPPDQARPLMEVLLAALRQAGCAVESGRFGANMLITSEAWGPVNVIVEFPA